MRLRAYLGLTALPVLGLAACSPGAATPTATATASPAVPSKATVTTTPAAASKATATATATTPVPKATAGTASPGATSSAAAASSYKDASYEVAGKVVRLVNGLSEVEAAPGSASKVVTRYFGNEATGDLNGDGVADVGFVLTQSPGGSGTFYYAVAALRTADGWTGTNAVLLGDRIAPQTTEYRDGVLIVNYAGRNPGEPMTTQPSMGVTKRLKVVGGRLSE